HAAADDDDPSADRQRGKVLRLPEARDIVDGVDDVFEFALPWQSQFIGGAEAHAKKDRVVVAAQVFELDVAAQRLSAPDLDAADRENEGGFLGREIVDGLIGGDAIFVEAAGLLARLE